MLRSFHRTPRRHTWPTLVVAVLLGACVMGGDSRGVPSDDAPPTTSAQRAIDSLLIAGDSIYRAQPESAAVLWAKAHEEATRTGDSVRVALALTGRGQAAMHLGQAADARRWGEEALSLKQRLGMKAQLFRSLNALGLLAWREDRFADALQRYGEAIAAAREVGDSAAVAKAIMNQGLVLQDEGLLLEARNAFTDAARRLTMAGDSMNLARTLSNLAAVDIALGEPQEAIRLIGAARTIASRRHDAILELNARGQLALAEAAVGAPQRAFVLIDSAIALARDMGALPEAAENLRVLGDLYLDAGDARHALDSYRQAAELHATLGQPAERASLLRQQARALTVEGNPTAAQRMARQAFAVHDSLGAHALVFDDLLLLLELAQVQGNASEVDRHLAQLAATRDRIGSSSVRGQFLLRQASELARRGRWDQVLQIVRRSSPLDSLLGRDEQAQRQLLLARAYAARGENRLAVEAARRAVALVEQVRAGYASGELRARYGDTRARVYAELTLALLREGNVAEAFSVADAGRGRSLIELLQRERSQRTRGNDTSASLTTSEENLLLRRIDALVRQLQVRDGAPARDRLDVRLTASAQMRDSLRVLRGRYEALRARRDNGLGSFKEPVQLVALQRSLYDHELLLEYLATPNDLIVFAVTRTVARAVAVPVRPESLAMRISLARALMEPQHGTTAARPLLEALHRDLLAPALAALPAQEQRRLRARRTPQLVMIPHGLQAAVPFAALVDAATGRHVVDEWTVLESPSAAMLVSLRNAPQSERSRGLHAFAPLTARLPASREEARTAVKHVARSATSTAFEDAAASEARMRVSVQQPVMVHLASHAVVNGHNPLFSRLELRAGDGYDGRLELHELLSLHVRAPLVFLSGCETAVGNVRSTRFEARDDFTSLAQAWLIAGARTVVATLWRIDDSAAATFADHFYRALDTVSAPEALALAQRAMKRDPRFAHPYFWAAYQTIGTDH